MDVQVEHKKQYGKDYFYPVNETARIFAEIGGGKTLTRDQINAIQRLGITVTAVIFAGDQTFTHPISPS